MGNWSRITTALLVIAASAGTAHADCQDNAIHVRGDWGEARFSVDVVDTPQTRGRGLMFVEDMPRMTGMLFVYDREQPVSFWMKNTLIPLDMIFANGKGVVEKVHSNAVPEDTTAIPGGNNIQYVLEINGGLADQLGIGAGSEMRHPSITGDNVAWSCDGP